MGGGLNSSGGSMAPNYEHSDEASCSMKCWEFVERMSNCRFLKKDLGSWSYSTPNLDEEVIAIYRFSRNRFFVEKYYRAQTIEQFKIWGFDVFKKCK
jgi:hypothetical protein